MAIADDFSVALNGDIRYTGNGATYYTVLELHRYLSDLADDQQASGNDLVDITTETPSDRATDNIITLNDYSATSGPTFNIDATAAEHLYNGSIEQRGGDDLFSGITVVGAVESGTELMIVQDDKVLAPYWGTGINANAAANIIMRVMVQTRKGGADIDGKRLRVQAAEWTDTRSSFSLTAGTGNSTAAVFTNNDLNNQTAEATVAGWSTIVLTEGYQELDIDGTGATGQEFYQQWATGSQTINDTFERGKWYQKRATAADSATETGTNYVVDNATITGQAQEFTARATTEKLVGCSFQLKIGGGTPTGDITVELIDSDDASPAIPTGAVLATSEPVDSNRLTNSYLEVFFRFYDNVTLTANQTYFLAVRHANGNATDFIHVEGDTADGASHPGNRAEDSGGWTGSSTTDLTFEVLSSPVLHGRAGELHRGITHEIAHDTASGNFTENEILYWGTTVTYDNLASGPFDVGDYVAFDNAGVVVNGGKVLADSGTVLTVALEDSSGGTLADNYGITSVNGTATATINVTINDQDKAGGEGVLLAFDDNGTAGDFYIQLIHGSAPVDNLQMNGRTSGFNALVNVTVTSRPLSPSGSFIGTSTGSNIIGAYGIGFDPTDVGASDQFFDLANTQRVPPNNVTFTVTGLVSGEDYVLVGPRSAGLLHKAFDTLNGTLTDNVTTSVVVTTAIPGDTPSSGTIRVEDDNGVYTRQPYTSYTGSTYTLTAAYQGSDNADATTGNNYFVSYIDELASGTTAAYTAVYSSDRDLFVRVRDGGSVGNTPIKTFESPATFGNASSSLAAIRTTDA